MNPTIISTLTEIFWIVLKSIFTVVVGFIVIKFSRFTIKKTMKSWKNHLPPKKIDTLQSMILSAIKYATYFLTFIAILSNFGISTVSIMTVAGVGSVAIGFASQSLVKDVITGTSILISNSFSVGDIITIGTCTGKVESLGIQSTKIRAINGDLYIIPNSEIKIITRIYINEQNEHIYTFADYEKQEEPSVISSIFRDNNAEDQQK